MNSRTLRSFTKSSFIPAFVLTGLIVFIGGCTSPRMLENRGHIPPATLTPPEDANEIVNDAMAMEGNVDITSANDLQGDFQGFPEVKTEIIVHKVKKGDSFWKIARMYAVGMKELAAHNNMDLKKPLRAGIVLEIPSGGRLVPKEEYVPVKVQTVSTKPSHKTANTKNGFYTVRPGDSLWLIAKRHNTTINKLTDANGISKRTPLKVGQKLNLPEGSKAAVKTASNTGKVNLVPEATEDGSLSKADNDLLNDLIDNSSEPENNSENAPLDISSDNYLPHTIKEGDSWNTVSEMYGISIASLKRANPKIASLKEPKVDTVINIPEE